MRSCEYKDTVVTGGLFILYFLWKLQQSKPVIFGGSIPSWACYLSEATKIAREEVVQPSKAVQLYNVRYVDVRWLRKI